MVDDEQAFEEALREALRGPVSLPSGFAERVLARTLTVQAEARRRWQHRAIAAGVAAAVAMGSASEALHVQARQKAQARQQFALAMRITDGALATALANGLDGQIEKTAHIMEEAGR